MSNLRQEFCYEMLSNLITFVNILFTYLELIILYLIISQLVYIGCKYLTKNIENKEELFYLLNLHECLLIK